MQILEKENTYICVRETEQYKSFIWFVEIKSGMNLTLNINFRDSDCTNHYV